MSSVSQRNFKLLKYGFLLRFSLFIMNSWKTSVYSPQSNSPIVRAQFKTLVPNPSFVLLFCLSVFCMTVLVGIQKPFLLMLWNNSLFCFDVCDSWNVLWKSVFSSINSQAVNFTNKSHNLMHFQTFLLSFSCQICKVQCVHLFYGRNTSTYLYSKFSST